MQADSTLPSTIYGAAALRSAIDARPKSVQHAPGRPAIGFGLQHEQRYLDFKAFAVFGHAEVAAVHHAARRAQLEYSKASPGSSSAKC